MPVCVDRGHDTVHAFSHPPFVDYDGLQSVDTARRYSVQLTWTSGRDIDRERDRDRHTAEGAWHARLPERNCVVIFFVDSCPSRASSLDIKRLVSRRNDWQYRQ